MLIIIGFDCMGTPLPLPPVRYVCLGKYTDQVF